MIMKQLQNNYRQGNLLIEIYECDNIVEFSNYIYTEYDCSIDSVINYHLAMYYSYDLRVWMIAKDAYKEVFCDHAVSIDHIRGILFSTMMRYAPFDKYIIDGLFDDILVTSVYINNGCDLDPVYLLMFLDTIEYQGALPPFSAGDDRIEQLIMVALCSIVFGRN